MYKRGSRLLNSEKSCGRLIQGEGAKKKKNQNEKNIARNVRGNEDRGMSHKF